MADRQRIPRYPRSRSIRGAAGDEYLLFVGDGGVRLDTAGPFPPTEAARLHRWLGRYLAAAAKDARLERRAAKGRRG